MAIKKFCSVTREEHAFGLQFCEDCGQATDNPTTDGSIDFIQSPSASSTSKPNRTKGESSSHIAEAQRSSLATLNAARKAQSKQTHAGISISSSLSTCTIDKAQQTFKICISLVRQIIFYDSVDDRLDNIFMRGIQKTLCKLYNY
jgi:hypothetical protein